MPKTYNPVLGVRVAPMIMEKIDQLVDEGKYRNRADVVNAALRLLLDEEMANGGGEAVPL